VVVLSAECAEILASALNFDRASRYCFSASRSTSVSTVSIEARPFATSPIQMISEAITLGSSQ